MPGKVVDKVETVVSSGPDKVKEPGNPKVVGSVADKVADDVDTVNEFVEKVEKSVVESKPVEAVPDKVADKVDTFEVVNKKPKEEGPWNRLVQSDSLREPDKTTKRRLKLFLRRMPWSQLPRWLQNHCRFHHIYAMFQSLRSR